MVVVVMKVGPLKDGFKSSTSNKRRADIAKMIQGGGHLAGSLRNENAPPPYIIPNVFGSQIDSAGQ